jgi:predicted ferric reductase
MTSIMTSLTSSITTIVTSSPTSIFNMTSTNNSIIVRALSHRKPVPPPDATYAELLFTTKSKIGWVGAAAMPTGWALWIVLAIIEVFSLPFIRRKGYFQVFYITHWFHVFYYILLILHCKNFWKWFIGPLVLVVFERIYNYLRVKSVKHGETFIKDVNLLSSKVTQLIITRPPNFKFKSGDYIYVKIPQIAKFEWHPFTISSAPERQDELWLHIRTLGNWTNKLYDYFQDMSKDKGSALQNFASPTKYERKMSNMSK